MTFTASAARPDFGRGFFFLTIALPPRRVVDGCSTREKKELAMSVYRVETNEGALPSGDDPVVQAGDLIETRGVTTLYLEHVLVPSGESAERGFRVVLSGGGITYDYGPIVFGESQHRYDRAKALGCAALARANQNASGIAVPG
jgi:hypothetical protein